MMKQIFNYIILNNILAFFIVLPLSAQVNKDTAKVSVPLYRGFTVELDMVPSAEYLLTKGVNRGLQGNLQFNLKEKFFPVIEIGYGGADKTLRSGTRYAGGGVYERIGIDFNLVKPNIYKNSFFVGMRLGMSNFSYDIKNITLADNYWGGSESIDINSNSATKFWFEIVGGMRVNVYKGFTMGWSVRNKRLLGNSENEDGLTPWFIPGYGKNNFSNWGFSYVIGYRF
ncbi:MAG: DUF6048 family protein [Paludibacteraceae bacterium]